jgi:hypothetical protein
VTYDLVSSGQNALEVIRLQERSVLAFDYRTFREDYERAKAEASRLREGLEGYKIDLQLSTFRPPRSKKVERQQKGRQGWRPRRSRSALERDTFLRALGEGLRSRKAISDAAVQKALRGRRRRWRELFTDYASWQREHPEYPSARDYEELKRAHMASREWRGAVAEMLADYNVARTHVEQFRQPFEESEKFTGDYELINSYFYQTSNRRYQAQHFWPSVVSDKEIKGLTRETDLRTYRQRWFRVLDEDLLELQDLVGVDISSSQTQILATLLGIKKLERLSMRGEGPKARPFKEYLAALAWRMHTTRKRGLLYRGYLEPKDNQCDARLVELVKSLWMETLYGSKPIVVVDRQRQDPRTYGPGWSARSASQFLKSVPGFKEVNRFFYACRRLAKRAVDRGAGGVIFEDPFDGEWVVWNPLDRKDQAISVGEDYKIVIRVPQAEPDGTYRLNVPALARKVAPCLVHMLDAFFSGLEMKELNAFGVATFVAIHDCWLVPPVVEGRDGREVLKEAIDRAAVNWYAGLGPVYRDLERHLGDDPTYGGLVRSIHETWQKRRAAGYTPKFAYK